MNGIQAAPNGRIHRCARPAGPVLKAHAYAACGPLIEPLLHGSTAVVAAQNGIPWWYFHRHGGPYDGLRVTSVDPDGAVSAVLAPERAVGCVVYAATELEVCPTGALSFRSEYDRRAAGNRDESAQTRTTTVCAYCGVGCNLTLHVQDNEIVKVTSPRDNPVTHGNLCIKGRFGYQHVQNRG
ncbi:hypothetical protein Saso_59430 [Streptomyces asoensis]|uniref:4Fe-4S Mo/W bis-MGD-type domain-containing protein n=1 Tax=Streptomyces asoensis TaxID=249586 RepID=A0ABQ3S845_9ACTN|nr:hypothetical protein GCM10010496_55440 [Streptomyces asoensis]GHI64293.1 hypothetical protein Saso_59430 [Streptomyces asoensis]